MAVGQYQCFLERSSKELKENLFQKKKNIEFEIEEDCNLAVEQNSLKESENFITSLTVNKGCQVEIMCEKLNSEKSCMHVFM